MKNYYFCLLLLAISACNGGGSTGGGPSPSPGAGDPRDTEEYVEPVDPGSLTVEGVVTKLISMAIPSAYAADDICTSTCNMGDQTQCAKLYIIKNEVKTFQCATNVNNASYKFQFTYQNFGEHEAVVEIDNFKGQPRSIRTKFTEHHSPLNIDLPSTVAENVSKKTSVKISRDKIERILKRMCSNVFKKENKTEFNRKLKEFETYFETENIADILWQAWEDIDKPTNGSRLGVLKNQLETTLGVACGGIDDPVDNSDSEVLTWTFKEIGTLPVNKQHFSLEIYGDKAYVIGGIVFTPGQDATTVSSTIEAFDLQSRTWSTSYTNMPEAKYTASSAIIGNEIYIGGGNYPTSSTNYKYNISTDTWSSIANSGGKNTASGVNINGKYYVLGGRDNGGNYLTAIEQYNSTANTWSNVGSLNTSRYFESVVPYQDTAIIVGGGSPGPVDWITDIQQFDTTTGELAYLATLPSPRMQGCAFIRGHHLIVIGGYGTSSIPGTELNRIDVLNLETKTWSTKLGPIGIMYNQKCIEWNGNYYFFGGDTPFGRSIKVYEFSP